jgi:hypothetical protein
VVGLVVRDREKSVPKQAGAVNHSIYPPQSSARIPEKADQHSLYKCQFRVAHGVLDVAVAEISPAAPAYRAPCLANAEGDQTPSFAAASTRRFGRYRDLVVARQISGTKSRMLGLADPFPDELQPGVLAD